MQGERGEVQNHWGLEAISDKKVVAAMEKVPRHLFVQEEARASAHENRPLPIGGGQETAEPFVVATMIEALRPVGHERVLEIGTGSGYQTAILAELVQAVYSVEIDPALAAQAEKRLRDLGYENVRLRVGDGYEGWIEEAPFDSIIVTAAVEEVPSAFMDQLKDGGRLVIPMDTPFGSQELTLIEKHGSEVITRRSMPVRFVSFRRTLSHGTRSY